MAEDNSNQFLTLDGLSYFYQKIKQVFVKQESGKGLSTNDFTDEYKNKLESLGVTKIKSNTTENWNANRGYIPEEGELIIYTDHSTMERDGETINVPGIKAGDGLAFLIDLPFIGEDQSAEDVLSRLNDHVQNITVHVEATDKLRWNNKLNMSTVDGEAVVDEALIFTRN